MNILRNASLRIKLQILTLICAAGLVSLAYTAYVALEPNVENTAYHHILEGKDALADVLPPPMFLVEAYTICHQLPDTDDPAELRRLEAALAKWKTDYYERSRYWQQELPAGPLRDTMTRELGEPVDDFFSIVEREFLPAVHSRNEDKCASLLMGSMLQA